MTELSSEQLPEHARLIAKIGRKDAGTRHTRRLYSIS